eukprot:363891-Chlamydomonas_euryale.AAC.13
MHPLVGPLALDLSNKLRHSPSPPDLHAAAAAAASPSSELTLPLPAHQKSSLVSSVRADESKLATEGESPSDARGARHSAACRICRRCGCGRHAAARRGAAPTRDDTEASMACGVMASLRGKGPLAAKGALGPCRRGPGRAAGGMMADDLVASKLARDSEADDEVPDLAGP